MKMVSVIFFFFLFGISTVCGHHVMCSAHAPISNGSIEGEICFYQKQGSNDFTVTLKIKGLSPGKHGVHVHEKSDLGNGCNNTGPHYNPLNKTHGCPEDPMSERHMGDLGNFDISSSGSVQVTRHYPNSNTNIKNFVDRGLVIHADVDDCGKGNYPDSKTSGHSGKRIACGRITGYKCEQMAHNDNPQSKPGKIITIEVGKVVVGV